MAHGDSLAEHGAEPPLGGLQTLQKLGVARFATVSDHVDIGVRKVPADVDTGDGGEVEPWVLEVLDEDRSENLKDPRLDLATITGPDGSRDPAYADVYVTAHRGEP